jgi:hypothetical protein
MATPNNEEEARQNFGKFGAVIGGIYGIWAASNSETPNYLGVIPFALAGGGLGMIFHFMAVTAIRLVAMALAFLIAAAIFRNRLIETFGVDPYAWFTNTAG